CQSRLAHAVISDGRTQRTQVSHTAHGTRNGAARETHITHTSKPIQARPTRTSTETMHDPGDRQRRIPACPRVRSAPSEPCVLRESLSCLPCAARTRAHQAHARRV